MAKILTAVVALAILAGLARWAMTRPTGTLEQKEASAPKQTLDNVRAKAKEIEANDQHYADEMQNKTASP